MTKKTELPPYSKAAHRAAVLHDSPVAIVLTTNETNDTWELRCWGKTPAFAYLAGLAGETALAAIDGMDFPPDIAQVIDLLNSRGTQQ